MIQQQDPFPHKEHRRFKQMAFQSNGPILGHGTVNCPSKIACQVLRRWPDAGKVSGKPVKRRHARGTVLSLVIHLIEPFCKSRIQV